MNFATLKNVLVFNFLCEVLSSIKTGIYLDNGFDQTAIDEEISKLEEHELEIEILKLLGLPNRPKRKTTISSSRKKSAPIFLMNIYKTLIDEERRSKRSVDLNDEEQSAVEESDVVMAFESLDQEYNLRYGRGKQFWFNVSGLSVANNIVSAEMKIFQNGVDIFSRKSQNVYTLTIYELVKSKFGRRKLQYVSSKNTTQGFRGWLSLNLTDCLDSWINSPHLHKGLYLSVTPVDMIGRELRPQDIGLIITKEDDETRPFMVAFLKAANQVQPRRNIRAVKSKNRPTKSEYASLMLNSVHHHSQSKACRIHTLYISFKDLDWQDWVIAPEGYAAYYCAGECNFPLNAHMNATKHALVQSLVHLIQPNKFPKPCCAPTELSSIPLIYYLDEGSSNVVLKKYTNMAVKSCGCH